MNFFTIPVTTFKSFLNRGHSRSVNAKKNIVASFLIKGGSIAISLLLVPLTIHYVNPTQYGIWLTLSSIIGWFTFFDVGLGNGLRNKFAEAVAKGEHDLAQIYVSTTYAILTIIICAVLIIFFCVNPFLNWAHILNTSPAMAGELRILALIVFVFFCIQFVLQLLTTILTANQQPAKASLFNFLGSLCALIIIFFLIKTTQSNLVFLGLAFSAAPVIVLIVASIWCFSTDYKMYVPSIKLIKFEYAGNLMSIGTKFFIIQIGVLVLLQTDNIIIIQLFGSKEVTTYNIVYKLFSIVIMIFSIVIAPLWSAFTEAYTKGEFDWIRRSYYSVQKFLLALLLFTVVLLFLSPLIFRFWIGNIIEIPFNLSIAIAMCAIANCWQMLPCFLLNGIGKIKLQLYLYIGAILLNFPLAFLLTKILGLAGVAISNLVILLSMSVILSIQCNKIMDNTAKGLWDK